MGVNENGDEIQTRLGVNENGDEIQTRLVLTRMVMRYRQDWY